MWTIYQKQRKNTESHKKENSRYIYQNKIDKACFRHDMAYGRFKGLPEITASDKTLHNKGFNIPKNKRHDAYQRNLASMFYKFFDKKFF